MEYKMIVAILAASSWYLVVTMVMIGLGIAYNAALNKDRYHLIPTSFKAIAGTAVTEILRVIGALGFMILIGWYLIYEVLNLNSTILVAFVVCLMITLWTFDALKSYAAMGVPLTWGDLVRWAHELKITQADELQSELGTMLKQLIRETRESAKDNDGQPTTED